jgi:hypothetical protein
MRTVLIYMLSLALLLLGGYHHVDGATTHHHLSKFIVSAEKFKYAKAEQQHASVEKTTVSDDKQSIFSVEEDDDLVYNRKFVQLTGYFITLFFAAFLFNSLKTLKKRLPYVTRLNFVRPQMYILQGSLLI